MTWQEYTHPHSRSVLSSASFVSVSSRVLPWGVWLVSAVGIVTPKRREVVQLVQLLSSWASKVCHPQSVMRVSVCLELFFLAFYSLSITPPDDDARKGGRDDRNSNHFLETATARVSAVSGTKSSGTTLKTSERMQAVRKNKYLAYQDKHHHPKSGTGCTEVVSLLFLFCFRHREGSTAKAGRMSPGVASKYSHCSKAPDFGYRFPIVWSLWRLSKEMCHIMARGRWSCQCVGLRYPIRDGIFDVCHFSALALRCF